MLKKKNVKSLETLGLSAHYSGLITTFLGIVTIYIDVTRSDFVHIQVGILIFVIGYSFVKISERISYVLHIEEE